MHTCHKVNRKCYLYWNCQFYIAQRSLLKLLLLLLIRPVKIVQVSNREKNKVKHVSKTATRRISIVVDAERKSFCIYSRPREIFRWKTATKMNPPEHTVVSTTFPWHEKYTHCLRGRLFWVRRREKCPTK